MALEALLPSEIARLVYGYLVNEKCLETANSFLEECTDMLECKNVLIRGGKFTTRVCGYQLLDILEQFCIISIFVQDKIVQLEVSDKLKNCSSLITKINVLLESCKEQSETNNCSASEEERSNTTQNKLFENHNYSFKKYTQNSNHGNSITDTSVPNIVSESDNDNESCKKSKNAGKNASVSSQTSPNISKKNELYKSKLDPQKTFETNCAKEMMSNKDDFRTNLINTGCRLDSKNEVKPIKVNYTVDSNISDFIKISNLEKEPREQDNADTALGLNKMHATNHSNEPTSKFQNNSFTKTKCGVDNSHLPEQKKIMPAVTNKTDPVILDLNNGIDKSNQVSMDIDHRVCGEIKNKKMKETVSNPTEKVVINSISNVPEPVNKKSNTNLESVKIANAPMNKERDELDFRLTVSSENTASKPVHKLGPLVNSQAAVFIINQESMQPTFLDISRNVESYSGKQVFSQTEVVEKNSNQKKSQSQCSIANTDGIFLVPHEIPTSTVTSTPIKIGFDTNEWYSSSNLPTPNLFFQRAGVCPSEETVSNNKLRAESPVALKGLTSNNLSDSSYIIVDKIEQGKLVKKKYARLKTVNTSVTPPEAENHNYMNDYLLDYGSPYKDKPLTPKIHSPSSNKGVSLTLINDDSKSIPCFGFITPSECPHTPDIKITPPNTDNKEKNPSKITCTNEQPVYKLIPITFDSPPVKQEINKVKVLKEKLEPLTTESSFPDEQNDKIPIFTKDFHHGDKKETVRMSKQEYPSCSSNESTCSHSSCSCDSDSDSTQSEDETEKKSTDDLSESFKRNNSNLTKTETYGETDLEVEKVLEKTNKLEKVGQDNTVTLKIDVKAESDPKVNFIDAGHMQSLLESSPLKVFSVIKSAEELAEMTNETPAKEDNGVQEEGIFETPFLTKPTDNSKYKLHDVMMKTEKIKPKIISIESVIPAIKITTASDLKAIQPNLDTRIEDLHSLTLKKQQQRIIVEKCKEEVNEAIKSIIIEGDKAINEQPETSIPSVTSTPGHLNESMNESKKVELSKAIQSITHCNHTFENSDDSEANLRLILDDEDKISESGKPVELNLNDRETAENPHNTRSKNKKEDLQFDDCLPIAVEINAKYEDSLNYGKRKHMKHYSDEDIATSFHIRDEGNYVIELDPGKMEIIYEQTPARKNNSTAKKSECRQSQKSPKKRKATNSNTNKNNKKRKNSVYIW